MKKSSFLVPSLALSACLAAHSPAQEAAAEVLVQDSQILYTGPGGLAMRVAVTSAPLQDLQALVRGEVVAVTWQENGIPHYSISTNAGLTFSRERETSYELKLRYQEFDPRGGAVPAVPAEFHAGPDNELFIVQYLAKGVEPWREEIRALGAVDQRYLAHHANVWRMTPDTAAAVEKLPFVRWVGPFHPAYKLEDELLEMTEHGVLVTRRYNVEVGEWGVRDKAVIVDAIQRMGGVVHQAIAEGWIVEATLTPQQLIAVTRMNEVMGVDRWGEPQVDMDNARAVMGADYVGTRIPGLDGTGVRAEVMDTGLDLTHVDWTNPPILSTTNGSDTSHGTCTFGINFANGGSTAGGESKGVLPNAQGIFAWYSGYGNRYTHTAKLVDPTQTYQCVYQSNSWGDPQVTSYTSKSQEMDDIIFLNDFSILQSQSNVGNQLSRPQAWAKNIISVGGINHFNNQNDADDRWNGGASIGPAEDGRIKPDMCGYYDAIWTSDADPGGYVSGDDYQSFGGTSGATPMNAGHLGLIYQMWHLGLFGNTPGASVFDSRPHNTLAKALLINSARKYPFSGTNHDLTRTHQGWGKPDLEYLYDHAGQTFWVNETDVLQDLQSVSYAVDVAGAIEFRATLVYIDRAGTTSSTLHRINDLSLKVTDPVGNVYWGNNGLLAGNSSTAGGVSNTKDTVENVIVQAPAAGTWTIEVYADDVNQDTHLETATVDADFALVVSPTVDPGATNTIRLVGPTLAFPNSTVTWTISQAPPNATFYMLWSLSNAGSTVMGHNFDLGLPINVGGTGTTNAAGDATFTATIPAAASGKTIYVEVGVDSGGYIFDSNMLAMTIT